MMSDSKPKPPEFGQPAPLFTAETDGIPNYSFGVVGGLWIVLMFYGSLTLEPSRQALTAVMARRPLFDDRDAAFFGVSIDAADRSPRGLVNAPPGMRYFWDFDRAVSRQYGLVDDTHFHPAVFLIDPGLRIVAAEPIERTEAVLALLEQHLHDADDPAQSSFAPVLTLPRLFEPAFCQELIRHFTSMGATESAFAHEVDGRTVEMVDRRLKRRRDVFIADETLVAAIRGRLETRLFPMVKRAYGWQPTHIERYLISAYGAEDTGFFSAHRDDVTAGTAHRKFAVTVNLNADAYEGGDLRFPEFGHRTYRPPTGGVTVFGCNLLHEVTPVTKGVRYALLPFLYDEAGDRLRRANLSMVGPKTDARRATKQRR